MKYLHEGDKQPEKENLQKEKLVVYKQKERVLTCELRRN